VLSNDNLRNTRDPTFGYRLRQYVAEVNTEFVSATDL